MKITEQNSSLHSFAETLPPCSETQIAQFLKKSQPSTGVFQKAGITKDIKGIVGESIQKTERLICDSHGEFDSQVFEISGLNFKTGCQKCKEEGEAKQAEEIRTKAETQRISAIEKNLDNSLIPLRYKECSFKNYSTSNAEERSILQDCLDYVAGFGKPGKEGASLILSGTVGTGKTHLACSLASELIKNHGKTAVYYKIYNAVAKVKDTYRTNSERSQEQVIASFTAPDLLILDEIGVQFGTEAEKRIMFQMIDERYDNKKSTILLSNMGPEDFVQFMGVNVTDRLKQNGGKFIIFNGKSKRK